MKTSLLPTEGRGLKSQMQGKATLMVFATLGSPDNLPQNKRVESIKVARLDPGSTPGGSTGMTIKNGTLEGAVFYVSVIFFIC